MKTNNEKFYFFNKRAFTKYCMLGARYIPWFFPRWLRYYSKVEMDLDLNRSIKSESSSIDKVSLCDNESRWDKCRIDFIIDKNQLDAVMKWIERFSLDIFNVKNYSGVNDVSSISSSIRYSIGCVSVNKKEPYYRLKEIYLKTRFIDHIKISLRKYGSDLFIINYDVFLLKEADEFINNITVNEPIFHAEFESYNIYSKQNYGFISVDKDVEAKDNIKNNINVIFNDVIKSWKGLNKIIGIDVNPVDANVIARIITNNNVLADNKRHVSWESRFNTAINARNIDGFSIIPPREDDGILFDSITINKENNDIKTEGFIINQFVFLSIIYNKLTKISKGVNSIVIDNKGKVLTDKHDDCFKLHYSLINVENLLLVFLRFNRKLYGNLESSFSSCSKNINHLKNKMENIYRLSENRVQIDSIRYTKRYSSVVFCFIVIQVLLAVVGIDFDKWSGWYEIIVSLL